MMLQDIVDMDTHENIRYVSESSNTSTSGYSTGTCHPHSPTSSVSSPASSPATMLQSEFSNLNLPPTTTVSPHGVVYTNLTNAYGNIVNYNPIPMQNQFPKQQQQQYTTMTTVHQPPTTTQFAGMTTKPTYTAQLRINEQPVEKFRFRYKSEMHGTHGSLNGANSKRTPKTYPEVELINYNGPAIIRCSLFQTNLDSPHSHQLVVRRDEVDICDPHDLNVSPEKGFVAMFQNMGIIHTAKKYIFEELFKKKKNRLMFELGRTDLSTKQVQELHKATEKEAKDMNLNQVRLCFEAFKIEENKKWIRIAEPVYTDAINNRKSAQTGELKIVRLSIATGSVTGGDDLILLVEKVSKKNIKVRFFEKNEDDETIWEAFGRFREADVHHQYAITCQTPAYKDKDIDKPVEVYIELIRPSDDERSAPPVSFRYKPKDSVVSRKRRRTCSTATSSSGSGSSVNSFEVPKTVQEQQQQQQVQASQINAALTHLQSTKHNQTISEEFHKDSFLADVDLNHIFQADSAELMLLVPTIDDFQAFELDSKSKNLSREGGGSIEYDGVAVETPPTSTANKAAANQSRLIMLKKMMSTTYAQQSTTTTTTSSNNNKQNNDDSLQSIFKLFDEVRNEKLSISEEKLRSISNQIATIYTKHAEKNDDSLIHDIILNDNSKEAFKLCTIISYFKLNELLNRVLNANNESGLHYACLNNRPQYIRPLLGLKCDPNIQDKNGNTALHLAVQEQNLECVESLLKRENIELNLTLRNDDGLNPLHLAIARPNINIAQKLLEYSPSTALLANSKEGNNALHMAVRQQNWDLVIIILNEEGVDKQKILFARNTAGHTALDIAKCFNTNTGNKIVYILRSYFGEPDADDGPGNLVIKEEDVSSSSADEDDGEETTSENVPAPREVNDDEEEEEGAVNLRNLLRNDKKFHKISKLLNENEKWRQLVEKSSLQKFLCLWSRAEHLLEYLQTASNVNYKTFLACLAEIDRDALDVLLTPIT